MKSQIIVASFVCSIAALIVALAAFWSVPRLVDSKFSAKESEIVHCVADSFAKMYEDLGVKYNKEPKTIEELFEPLIKIGNTIK